METDLQHLMDVLSLQMGLMADMAGCLAAEREAVIGGEREQLERQVARKERLVQQIQEAETRRRRQVEAVCASLDISDSTLTLEQLADLAPPAWSQRLRTCRDELQRQLGRVRQANEANQVLVAQSLSLVQGSLQMLGEISPNKGTYGAGGKVTHPSQAGRLLKGAV
ncbi:MAG: flagellar protein FlgN [Desulfobacterales bacterium]